MRLLILGGTAEANALVRRIAGCPHFDPILSLAGRTRHPAPPPIPFRIGGFGGIAGLKTYLIDGKIDAVIDATHPFAAQMSAHAAAACCDLAIPLAVLTRPAWGPEEGDRWIAAADIPAAARALGERPRRVFLTVGGSQLAAFAAAPQHHYIVRAIERPNAIAGLPCHRLVLARGPFSVEDETALMQAERVEMLVTKNSGGAVVAAKLAAARALCIPVVMVERPAAAGDVPTVDTAEAALAWIDRHRRFP